MKIIISRKGFDAENGKTPSPVMPDGAMLSFPIPQYGDADNYSGIYYDGKSYKEIWKLLKPSQGTFPSTCHLDPDIRPSARKSLPNEWKSIFGQCGAAETHLENQGVTIGDVFLFFGWFRQTEVIDGKLSYCKKDKDAHMLFGYLQIGEIVRGQDVSKYCWHPHSNYYFKSLYAEDYKESNNTMYIASDKLIVNREDTGLPGYGTFKFSEDLVLTMPGMAKSRWKLPDFFKEVDISCHSNNSWKPEGYFQSVRIGQEFVVSENPQVTEWAKNIIINNYDERNKVDSGD